MHFASRKGASVKKGSLSMPCCGSGAVNNTGKHELVEFFHWHLAYLKLGSVMLTLMPYTISSFIRLRSLDLKF